jgi:hypothetical protein
VRAEVKQVRDILAVVAATRRTEQLNEKVGPSLEEVEAGQRLEWKDIANCNPASQGLPGPMEVPGSFGWHTGAPLGVHQQTI